MKQKRGFYKSKTGMLLLFSANLFLITMVLMGIVTIVSVLAVRFGWLPGDFYLNPATGLIVAYVLSLVICVAVVVMINRVFMKPIRTMVSAMEELAQGRFDTQLSVDRGTEKVEELVAFTDSFNKAATELALIETLKTDFAANVSHEINTPLAIIQNYASALQKEDLSPEQRKEYSGTIIAASNRLSNLVANILKLNKLENQEILPEMAAYDLCEQLSECVFSFDALLEEKGIAFSAEMDDRAMITADREMLDIVWNNLLANAIKFTPPGGAISLTQTSSADGVAVAITDTGCGMGDETLRHLFDKFYQGDTSHSQEGNGLGLALALRVVDILGGRIAVESELDKGSHFIVELPVAP